MKSNKIVFGILSISIVWAMTTIAYAIDNPDAPDYLGEFISKAKYYQDKIDNPRNTNKEFLMAYNDYLTFLDKELNKAFELLMEKIPENHRKDLINSQKKWMAFREAELEFINNNWSRNNFGSSFVISRGTYRCSIVKNRIIELLHYASNY